MCLKAQLFIRKNRTKRNTLIEKILSDSKSESDPNMTLVVWMICYYMVFDLEHGSNDCQIFKELYVNKKSNNSVSLCANISEATLERRIKRYDALAKLLIITLKKFESLIKYL